MHRFEVDSLFCGSPDCELHVRAGVPGVVGRGKWAQLRDRRMIGRSIYCGVFLCDVCLREWQAVSAILPDGAAIGLR